MTVSDNNNQTASAAPALALYGKMLTFSRLQFSTSDLGAIEAQLTETLSNKSSNIPILLDSDVEQDLSALVELLWSWGLQPIGVVTGLLDDQAREQRLAIFPADGKRIERIVPSKTAPTPSNKPKEDNRTESVNATSTESAANISATETTISSLPDETLLSAQHITSLIYDQMLRSGQSLNHVGGDLILTNSVNSGAEAITDNSLHVYGRAQGRLVAGATGDKDARIFCQVFNPSLVSVAGTYCLRDNLPEHVIDKPVQVKFVEGEGLVFIVMDEA
ncbi:MULTISPECIES: septum site-determining protein MinC [Psychrobacter]|jgi:septum site-determining protein MinC|uniref:Probable septum site-determining protein MinC n=1 Tax=Psychrobacter pacificensis TaxID=112002 RepID=A0A1G6WTK5_9GAMM|nr:MULTISPECIES: septum site-determining protein MinC [Psychrobacter]AOY44666.1 septum site determining protein [Psychrobacter sp. AntiMn-1]GLR29300.1 putative septum site-determining protein MinC [Psychrobacter pacificensis]SDD68365.1 septum site-determining protein MinC [Psychrobacter pacificensis]HBL97390.1 septum site-determining protein MinC [Psychrobacter sp.]